MSDLLTRFQEYKGAQVTEQAPAPVLDRFEEYKKQKALTALPPTPPKPEPEPDEKVGIHPFLQKLPQEPLADIFFDKLARWQAGERIDPKEKDWFKKTLLKAGRVGATLPIIPLQFFHAILSDPKAAIPGFAEMLKDAVNNFSILVSPDTTEEQREELAEYLVNNPWGFAFATAIIAAPTARLAISKAPKVPGVRARPPTKAERVEAAVGEEIPVAEVPKPEASQWSTRTADLKRIHVKQRRIPLEDVDFREIKKAVAGKESLKDFTWGEMVRFEAKLDQMVAREEIRVPPAKPAKPAKPAPPGLKPAKPAKLAPWQKHFKRIDEVVRRPGEDLVNKAPSETLHTSAPITDTAIPEGMFDAVTSPRGVFGRLKLVPDFIKQSRKRVKTRPGQEMLSRIRKADELLHRRVGDMMERFNQLGLKTIKKRGWGERLGRALQEEGKATPFRELFDDMYKEAATGKIKIAGYTSEYFPRMVKRDIAEILQGDLATLEKTAFKKSADIWPLLKEAVRKKHIKDETIRALDKLVESGQATTYIDAFAKLKNFSHNEMFSPFGNLEATRRLELPLDFYEMDATKVIPQYVYGWAKRLAEVEQFGPKSEIYNDLRIKIDAINPKERYLVDHMVAAWTRSITRDPRYSMTKKWKRFSDTVVQFEVITKIGLGTATIPNITQSFISTIPHFGVYRTARGFYRALHRGQTASLVRRSGALMDLTARQWAGYEATGLMGKVSNRILSIAFTPINKMNATLSAATTEFALPGYYELANSVPKGKIGKARVAHAKRMLEFLDVNPAKPLTENVTLEAMYRAATDLQVMKNVLRDPLSAHNPRLKAFWLFKRFGLKQAQLIGDIVLKEIKHGNVMPLLRLAAGGYLGGEFVLWAVNKIKSDISGKEYYTEDKEGWERVAMVYGAVGAFGVITSVVESGIFGDYPFSGTVKFTVLPVQVQTLEKIADTVFKFASEAQGDYGLLGAVERLKGTAPRLMGPLGTQVGKRIQTDAQRAARLRFERGQARAKILDLFLDGKSDQAIKVWTAWNRHNLHNVAFGRYDEYGRFLGGLKDLGVLLNQRELERAKKKARP